MTPEELKRHKRKLLVVDFTENKSDLVDTVKSAFDDYNDPASAYEDKDVRIAIWDLSWSWAISTRGRSTKDGVSGRIYKKEFANDPKKTKKFRKSVCEWIDREFLYDYINFQVSEDQHIQNIVDLAYQATNLGGGNLESKANYCYRKDKSTGEYKRYEIWNDHDFRIGIAQLLLNLKLKYLWCLGLIERTPHCPINEHVIEKAGIKCKHGVAWSKINCIESYCEIIEDMKVEALKGFKYKSLAEWELVKTNEGQDEKRRTRPRN